MCLYEIKSSLALSKSVIASPAACCQADVRIDDKPEAGLTFGRYFWFDAANRVAVVSAEVPDAGADAAFNSDSSSSVIAD